MIYPDPTPDFGAIPVAATPTPTPPGGGPPRTPRREWRRATLMPRLVDPPVVAEDAALLEAQARDINSAFKPRNGWQDWLTTAIAVHIVRLNRCERIERRLRDVAAYRAIDFWEDDRKLAAETLALRLAKEPGRTVLRLQATAAGLDWLMARWRFLAGVAPAEWTDAQRALAVQLVGADPTVDPAAPGFARGRLDELGRRRERAAEADAVARGLVESDLSDDVPGLAALRRYAQSLRRQVKWFVDQFHVEHPDRWDDPMRRPAIERPEADAYRPPNRAHIEGEGAASFDDIHRHLTAGRPPITSTPTSRWLAELAAAEAAAAQLHADETNPSAADFAPAGDETDPLDPPAARPRCLIEPAAPALDYSNERGRNHSRPRRPGETSREYARRQERARRRTDLALADRL